MRRFFPISLLGLVATPVVFLLQIAPSIGIFLMMVGAAFWSAVLINASMIGVAIEVAAKRVARAWLLLPLLFYGGYWVAVAADHLALRQLRIQFDEANEKVAVDFDPTRHALVFQNGDDGGWLTQNFALPVAYAIDPNSVVGYRSKRLIEFSVCKDIGKKRAQSFHSVSTIGFYDRDTFGTPTMEKRFCSLSMPEKPKLPVVRVASKETKELVRRMPVTRRDTVITMPDGRRYNLLGGVASPLAWIPIPILGCALNSAQPSWDCTAQFTRNRFVPIVSGNIRFGRDSVVLAKALGLKPVSIDDRVGGDHAQVLKRLGEIEASANPVN